MHVLPKMHTQAAVVYLNAINVREVLPQRLSKNCTQLSIYQINIF